MSASNYPAPRWFREAVRDWIGEYGILCEREYAISDLFTRLARSQPPDLRVVGGTDVRK